MVRSPDGESRSYSLGSLTVQRAAAWVLQKYYTDFPIFNPYLQTNGEHQGLKMGVAPKKKPGGGNLKYYDIDGYDIQEEKVIVVVVAAAATAAVVVVIAAAVAVVVVVVVVVVAFLLLPLK